MSAREMLRRERERKNAKKRNRAERRVRRVLRLPEVEKLVGLKHASIYCMMAEGRFPRPIPIGLRAVAWVEDEILDWLEACIAERDSGTSERSLPLAGQRRKMASPKGATLDNGTLVPSSKSNPLTGKSKSANLTDLSDTSAKSMKFSDFDTSARQEARRAERGRRET